jgi:hypothetical protein
MTNWTWMSACTRCGAPYVLPSGPYWSVIPPTPQATCGCFAATVTTTTTVTIGNPVDAVSPAHRSEYERDVARRTMK